MGRRDCHAQPIDLHFRDLQSRNLQLQSKTKFDLHFKSCDQSANQHCIRGRQARRPIPFGKCYWNQ